MEDCGRTGNTGWKRGGTQLAAVVRREPWSGRAAPRTGSSLISQLYRNVSEGHMETSHLSK